MTKKDHQFFGDGENPPLHYKTLDPPLVFVVIFVKIANNDVVTSLWFVALFISVVFIFHMFSFSSILPLYLCTKVW
jgi:hypothetical protein